MINWIQSEATTPEGHLFSVVSKCLSIMGPERVNFAEECAQFVIVASGDALSDVQKVGVATAADNMRFDTPYDLANVLNKIMFLGWSELGVKNMPEGAAMTPEQRLGFIQGIYGYAAQRIAQHVQDMETLLAVPYQHPTIPAPEA